MLCFLSVLFLVSLKRISRSLSLSLTFSFNQMRIHWTGRKIRKRLDFDRRKRIDFSTTGKARSPLLFFIFCCFPSSFSFYYCVSLSLLFLLSFFFSPLVLPSIHFDAESSFVLFLCSSHAVLSSSSTSSCVSLFCTIFSVTVRCNQTIVPCIFLCFFDAEIFYVLLCCCSCCNIFLTLVFCVS